MICVFQALRRTSGLPKSSRKFGQRFQLMQKNTPSCCFGKQPLKCLPLLFFSSVVGAIVSRRGCARCVACCVSTLRRRGGSGFPRPLRWHSLAGNIFHIVFHLFPVVPSAVYPQTPFQSADSDCRVTCCLGTSACSRTCRPRAMSARTFWSFIHFDFLY